MLLTAPQAHSAARAQSDRWRLHTECEANGEECGKGGTGLSRGVGLLLAAAPIAQRQPGAGRLLLGHCGEVTAHHALHCPCRRP